MTMLQLRGGIALSPFRRDKLLQKLIAIYPSVTDVAAEYRYFVDISQPVSEQQQTRLNQLLNDGSVNELSTQGQLVLVIPRAGTIYDKVSLFLSYLVRVRFLLGPVKRQILRIIAAYRL